MSQQSASLKTLFSVFGALMVLLVATVAVANLHVSPHLALAIALAIAIAKALLIILYFMGVRYSSQRVWLFAGAGFFWLLIMLTILDDYVTRGWLG